MAFDIKNPGLATTVQDQGRTGHYNVGIPQSGSLDQYSAELGNVLVGNTAKEAVLECTYLGPVLTTDQDAVVAVTGAPVDVKVNGEARPQWTRLQLNAGDELSFGVIQGGTRYYIAVQGGIDVPEVLGSRSTYSLGAIGGFQGRKLEAGDQVPVGRPAQRRSPARRRYRSGGIPSRIRQGAGRPDRAGAVRPPPHRRRTGQSPRRASGR